MEMAAGYMVEQLVLRIGWVEMENFWYPVVLFLKLAVRLLMGLTLTLTITAMSLLKLAVRLQIRLDGDDKHTAQGGHVGQLDYDNSSGGEFSPVSL